jgi:peptidoglycan/LPS O-acetylase OafA/YrhL
MSDEQDESGPPLLFERLRRIAPPIAAVVIALLVVTLAWDGPLRDAGIISAAALMLIVWGRGRGQRDDDDDRPYGPEA